MRLHAGRSGPGTWTRPSPPPWPADEQESKGIPSSTKDHSTAPPMSLTRRITSTPAQSACSRSGRLPDLALAWHAIRAFSGTSSRNTQCPCRGGLGAREEVGAVSKPRGRSRRGKGTARKVSEILNSIARLVQAVSVLVDALGRWLS